MRILQVNKFFYIHGGASRYFFEVSALLHSRGHEVAYFSMEDPRNEKSKWAEYFINKISFEKVGLKQIPRVATRMFYSIRARKNISYLLDIFKPDIVHLHSIYHHISPSILLELKKRNIPIVQTIHDYHLISPNHNLFHEGRICEVTKPDKYYKALFHKCIKNSYLASFAEVTEKYLHHWLGWERKYIDYYITPSLFMKNKLMEYNISKEKIIHLPHFVNYRDYEPDLKYGDYILYFGRLSEEKGLADLLKVMNKLPAVKLIIAGRGNQDKRLRIINKKLGNKNVEFVGFRYRGELRKLISMSRFTVLPSVWYENFPNSILESFASGKIVVASDIGGIPEMIKDNYNGFLFKAGSVENCRDKIIKLWDNLSLCRKMGKNARNDVERYFNEDKHYMKLMQIYKRAINC